MAALDALPVSLYIVDRDLRIVAWNHYREQGPLGVPRDEALGRPLREVLTTAGFDAAHPLLQRVLDTGEPCEEIAETRHAGRLFHVRRLPILHGGHVTHVLSWFEDITERKHAEDRLRQAQKMEAVGQLAGGVAHDFNNLLSVITGYAGLVLRRLNADDPSRVKIEQIQRAAEKAATLTRQLLAFSRRQVLEPRILDLNGIVADVEKMLRRLIAEDIQIVTVLSQSLGHVMADPGQIEQVIMNLAVNARDAMPRGGKLVIETANEELDEARADEDVISPGPYVVLAVTDTGVGMDAETRDRIFEPFFTTKEQGKGTGLGLATVYGIVKQSRGHIRVRSEPGRGTTFTICLPRVEGTVERVRTAPPEGPPAGGSETILLVEDEESLRCIAREILEEQGYAVVEAWCGPAGLDAAESHRGPIHMLLTDVVMPGMSGPELVRALISRHPQTKILYMSGYTDEGVGDHGVLDASTQLILKPFTTEALLRKVREVLDAR